MRRLVTLVVLVMAAVLLPASTHAVEHQPVQFQPSQSQKAQSQPLAAARLVIPAIGVDAGIIPVGVRNGALAVGGSVRDVYRWRHGVRAGQPGSAVLAGHTWSRGHGVFDDLGKLRPGHRISVGRAHFRVTRVRKVRSLAAAGVRNLFTDRGKPRLVLITCGDRDAAGVYHTRIIVFAKKVKRPS